MSEEFDDLYATDTDDYQNETRPLDEILRQSFETAMTDIHTWLPARVTVVHASGYVDVQPLLKRKYTNGTLIPIPIIQSVPVQHPRGANWYIKLPIAVGDLGRAVFCERSLDSWKSGDGGITDPGDPRKFDLSDAVFVPGLYPANSPLPGAATDMVLNNGQAQITLEQAGKFLFANDSQELLAVLAALVDTLISAKVLTAIGPQPFTPDTIADLNGVLGDLEDLTGG